MKVSTDACILGAWFATKVPTRSSILDMGSGTGLLMMMLAQKTEAKINGIEIDLPSFLQSAENIRQNNWGERLSVFLGDARTASFPVKYDFIICNPPFFENDLLSVKQEEKVAKHSIFLTLNELIMAIDVNLQWSGSFGILLPYHRWEYFNEIATAKGFHLTEKLFVKQTAGHTYFRTILHFSRGKENFVPPFELIIKRQDGTYTAEFAELLKDYYLQL